MKLFNKRLYLATFITLAQQGFTSDLLDKNQFEIRLINVHKPVISSNTDIRAMFTNTAINKEIDLDADPRHYVENHSYFEIDHIIASV